MPSANLIMAVLLLPAVGVLAAGDQVVAVASPALEPGESAFSRPTSALQQQEAAFEVFEVVLGEAERQTVLTGFLLGNAVADIVVLSIEQARGPVVRVYSFDGTAWSSRLETTLDPGVSFVDVVNIGGRDRMITYRPGGLSWFDPEAETERGLVAMTSSFEPPRSDQIPHVDVTRDVNGDGRDDLVVPDVDGFWLLVQTSAGAFATAVKVGPPAELSGIYGADGYRYDPWSQSRIHQIDYNLDGRGDLVFWSVDHFEAHLQGASGLFAPTAVTFTTDVEFDSDEIWWLASGNMRGKVLHSLADLNGDGIGDLVIYSLDGASIADKRTSYQVHLGARAPGGTEFSPDVGLTFQTDDRIQLGMRRHDFDSDGGIDLMLTTIAAGYLEPSFARRLGRWLSGRKMSFGVMGDDIWLDVEFYRARGGQFADEPDAAHRIALDGPPSSTEPGWVPLEIALRGGLHASRKMQETWPRAFNTTLRIGDVTGDGRADLLIGDHPRILDVFVGVPEAGLFDTQRQEVMLPIPNDEEYVWLTDLDGDGKQDLIMHHPFTLRDAHGAPTQPPGSEPHRVTVLIAR